jgi:hypothetical protein
MGIGSKLPGALITLVSLSLLCTACQGNQGPSAPSPADHSSVAASVSQPSSATASSATARKTQAALAAEGSSNGAAGQMPAYYEGQLFTVNMKQMPDNASKSLIGENSSVNEIYASNDLDEEQDFVPVINAIQGEGFNPLWRQILIVFKSGVTPHQFVSEEEVKAAAAGPNPEITLVETDEVYRCSVVGRK